MTGPAGINSLLSEQLLECPLEDFDMYMFWKSSDERMTTFLTLKSFSIDLPLL